MKAVVAEGGRIKIRHIPFPQILENEVLIKVLKAGICNTDLELAKGYMNFQGVLGHEFVGKIVQGPKKGWVGKRIVGEINLPCGDCEFCRAGITNHCLSRKVLGIHNKKGAFTEYLTLPLENCHLLPQSISDEEGIFVEPLAASLEIFEQIRIRRQDSVLVQGDGKLGLLIAQIMKLKTEKVFCIGKYERKLNILKKRGVQTLFKGERIYEKFDVVVEATGNKGGIEEALVLTKPRGTIVLKSTFHGLARIDISKTVVDEIKLIGSRCGPFPKAIDILREGLVDVKEMVDGDFALEKAPQAFSFARKSGTMKVLITPQNNGDKG